MFTVRLAFFNQNLTKLTFLLKKLHGLVFIKLIFDCLDLNKI